MTAQFIFRGVRGSTPTPRARNLRYGGNTCCVEVVVDPMRRVLIDCGTGLLDVGSDELSPPAGPGCRYDVFLTHLHADHIQGLPFFAPLADPSARFTFYGHGGDDGLQALLEQAFRPPWFPHSLPQMPAHKSYVALDGQDVSVGGLRIRHARLNHPQGVTAYRVERAGRAIVFATDVERGDPARDSALRDLAAGADVLIHDAQYTPEELERHRGWGHSSWEQAIEAAREAGVARLVLFHHDPARSDDELDAIVARARAVFPAVEAAREGLSIAL